MVYADTTATQADYDKLYQNFNKYATRYEGRLDYLWNGSVERVIKYAHVNPDSRILDIGCANGEVLAMIRKRGFKNLLGIDPSLQCSINARKNDLNVVNGTLSNLPNGFGTFDCVMMTHVVEHICNVAGAIKRVKALLKPQGMLYIEVPDAGNQYSVQINGPFQEINTEHINCFSEQCLRNLASVHSMKTIKAGTAISDTFPVAYLVASNAPPVPMQADRELRYQITDYLNESERVLTVYLDNLANDLEGIPEVMLWGAGELVMKLLCLFPLAGMKIAAIIDSYSEKTGHNLSGIPVIGPDTISKKNTLPIVITSVIHRESIRQSIAKYKLTNRVIELRGENGKRQNWNHGERLDDYSAGLLQVGFRQPAEVVNVEAHGLCT
jgi:SAM-dependent methyltransferase